MEYGWAGSGTYLTSPIVVLTSELTGLASSSGDVLAVSAAFANTQGAAWADVEFVAGGAFSPVPDAFLELWIIRSIDGGQTFEDGSATMAPARGADKIVQVVSGTSIIPRSGAPGLLLSPGTFKVAVRNQMGVAIPANSQVRLGVYAEGSGQGASGATLMGDASGTEANRVADMLERFGVITYSAAASGTNPWGAGVSDYTTDSVIQAVNYLTANSGCHLQIREYHVAGRDTGGGSNQLSWCPTVASATGAKFSVSILRGGVTADATSLGSMAASSAAGSGWMQWAEGLNTPNDGSVTAANCVTVQQTLFNSVIQTSNKTHPVTCVGPSFTYNTLPPETSTAISGYLTAVQKSDLLAASSMASARFFPTLNPDADDGAGRAGNADDVALGHQIYWGKPALLAEYHPTSGNTDSPSHATDDSFAAYYAALMMLNADRLDYQAWFWKSLFDIGQSGDSPFVRVGLFPNKGSDTPRLSARTIRAFYALTGDSGSARRSFNPALLDYTVTGLPAPVSNATPWTGGHHRLYQNSGGTFYLFIWNEQRPILGTGTTITVRYGRQMSKITHYDLTTNPATAETAVETLTNTTSHSFSLTASVHLFVILPQGSTISAESAQGTQLTSATGAIIDSNGVAFTLVNNPPFGFQVNHAGITDSQNVALLLYWDHKVYQQRSNGDWFYWDGASWIATTDPRVSETESPNGLEVTTTGVTIFASQTPGQAPGAGAALDHWTLTNNATVAKNGIEDGTTANVISIYYLNHFVYMQQTTGNAFGTPGWSRWNGSSWVAVASPKGITESPEGTQVSTAGPVIYASTTPGSPSTTLDTWALQGDPAPPSFRATRNGVWDGSSAGVTLLYYHNHSIYHSSGNPSTFGTPGWWVWNGTAWVDTPDPTGGSTGPTESVDGTVITSPGAIILASPNPGVAATPSDTLQEWTFNASGQVVHNGSVDTSTSSVISMAYFGHFVYHSSSNPDSLGQNPGWWRWNGSAWIDSPNPQGGTPTRTISIATIPQEVAGQNFPVTGTLTGYTNAPSLQYRDNNGSWLAFPSGSQVTATAFNLNHPGIPAGTGSGAPAPAAAVGYTMHTYSATPATLDTNVFHWDGVGSNAAAGLSQSGDHVHDSGGQGNHFNDHGRLHTASGGSVTAGKCFGGGGYFEADIAFANTPVNGTNNDGWPAYWMNPVENDGGFPGLDNYVEQDIFEFYRGNKNTFNSAPINWYPGGEAGSQEIGLANEATAVLPGSFDPSQRHKYGCLHVPATSTTQGYFKLFVDGVQYGYTWTWDQYNGSSKPSGFGGSAPLFSSADIGHWKIMFGTGSPNPMDFYGFEAWQVDTSKNLGPGTVPTQSGGGSPATYTVGVRDASATTVQATSNSFQVVPPGSFTLTGITLSNTSVIAGSASGTAVGTIAVQASGGTFTGTLAVNDTTHFSIAGTTLRLATTLATGNYPITITATQTGAVNSPLSVNFTITAQASGNSSINFSAPTGKTVNRTLWGFTLSIFEGNVFTNGTFRNTANTFLKPAALWINPDWELDQKFDNGDMTDINGILNNYRSFCQSGVRVIMGVAHKTSSGSASTVAARAANFANYLRNNGFSDIMDFTVGNQWGDHGGDGVSQSTMITYFNAVSDALHGVNSSYRVWGPPQWDPGFYANATFGNSANMATRCNGVCWMSYDVLPNSGTIYSPMTDSKDTAYQAKGINNPDGTTQRSALANTPLANVKLGAFDLNMSEYANEAGQYVGGVYMACYIVGVFQSTPGGIEIFTMQGIGGSNWPGNAIGSGTVGNDMTRVTASGYLLGKCGQSVFGPEYTSSSTIANLRILATKPSASTFAIMIINYDTSNSRTLNLAITGGVPSGTIARWEIGKSGGTTPTPTTGTQSSLGSVTVASETVVILTGTLS